MGKESFKIIIICLVSAICLSCFGFYLADSMAPEQSQGSTGPSGTGSETPTGSIGTRPTALPSVPSGETTESTPVMTAPSSLEPSSQATQPSTDTTAPSSEATEPSSQATQPSTDSTAPSSDTTAPTTEATQPATAPSTSSATTEPVTEPTLPPVEITLSARNAFVYDLLAEEFLFLLGDPDAPVEPASITKLFTAYVGLQYFDLDAELTVGEEVAWIDPYSSKANLEQGQRLTMEMCIQAMIIPSGNDAAYVLAVNGGRAIAGDPALPAKAAYDLFVAEMNAQAAAMGMTGTHFVNPDGMNDENHYTTLRDMLLMAKLAMETPVIAQAAATPSMDVTLLSGQTLTWKNSNLLLHEEESEFYRAEAIGLKTGSTSSAGKCLISAFQKEDRLLLICVMGCPESDDRYIDTLALYDLFA